MAEPKFTIKATSPKGYAVELELSDSDTKALMPRVLSALDWLETQGFTPTDNASVAPATNGNGAAPACQYHGAMKRSKKFAGWFCPAKMGDGSYCQEKVMD